MGEFDRRLLLLSFINDFELAAIRQEIVNGREPLSVVVLYHGFGVSFSDQSRFRFSVCYFDAAQDIFGTATAGCARRSAFHKMMTATEAERIDPAKTAILAAAKSDVSVSAWVAINSDIVKPIPASAPAPASWRQEYSSGLVATPSRTASTDATTIPTGLPILIPNFASSPRSFGIKRRIVSVSKQPISAYGCAEDSQGKGLARLALTQIPPLRDTSVRPMRQQSGGLGSETRVCVREPRERWIERVRQ
jgi:hypothetical protein